MLKTIGSSSIPNEVEQLYQQGLEYIKRHKGLQTIGFHHVDFKEKVKKAFKISRLKGPTFYWVKFIKRLGLMR